MQNRKSIIYWDSCVFLNYIEGTEDKLPVLENLLHQATGRHEIQILTSVIAITEVAFVALERAQKVLDPDTESKIEQFWNNRSAVKLIEFHAIVAREARELMRLAVLEGWSLKPADAIHLASARRMNAAEFQTYDQALLKYQSILGIPILEPHTDQLQMSL